MRLNNAYKRFTVLAALAVSIFGSIGVALGEEGEDPISEIGFDTIPGGTEVVAEQIGLLSNVGVSGDLEVVGPIKASGGIEFPDGTMQSTAASSCSERIRYSTLQVPVDTAGESDHIVLSASEAVQWVSSQLNRVTGNILVVFAINEDYTWEFTLTTRLDTFPTYFKGPLEFWLTKIDPNDDKGMATFRIMEECP